MKKIIFIAAVFILSAFISSEPMLIKPGEAAGTFIIEKTKMKEITEKLGSGTIKENVTMSPVCGMHFYSKVLVYEKEGISFSFEKNEPNKNTKIYSIGLHEQCNAATAEGIRTGQSTRAAIKKAYGSASKEEDAGYGGIMEYRKLGIDFIFKHAWNVKSEADTVRQITVYPKSNF